MKQLIKSLLLTSLLAAGHAFAQLEGSWYVVPKTKSVEYEIREQFKYLNRKVITFVGRSGYDVRRSVHPRPLRREQVNYVLTTLSFVPIERLYSIERNDLGYTFIYGCSIRSIVLEDRSEVQSTAGRNIDLVLIEDLGNGGFIIETITPYGGVAVERYEVHDGKLYQSLSVIGGTLIRPLVIRRVYVSEIINRR